MYCNCWVCHECCRMLPHSEIFLDFDGLQHKSTDSQRANRIFHDNPFRCNLMHRIEFVARHVSTMSPRAGMLQLKLSVAEDLIRRGTAETYP